MWATMVFTFSGDVCIHTVIPKYSSLHLFFWSYVIRKLTFRIDLVVLMKLKKFDFICSTLQYIYTV